MEAERVLVEHGAFQAMAGEQASPSLWQQAAFTPVYSLEVLGAGDAAAAAQLHPRLRGTLAVCRCEGAQVSNVPGGW